jgi:tetratricopeptide (TPR) repeat protein
MSRRLVTAAFAALVLSACGGGGEAAPRTGDALPGVLIAASDGFAGESLAAARGRLEAQLATDPDRLDVLVDLATTWQLEGRPEAAQALLDEVVSRGAPEDQQAALVNLAALYAEDGYQAAAAAYLETARDVDPARAEPHYALALLASGRDQHAKALAHLKEALRLDPSGAARAALVFARPEAAQHLEALLAEARADAGEAALRWREVARGSFPALAHVAEKRLQR